MKKIKVYCSAGHRHEASWIDNHVIVNSIEECDILVLGGGSDINPGLYKHPNIASYPSAPTRDKIEWEDCKKALELNIPIVGICRGCQMLAALSGGVLIQDVSGHSGSHNMETNTGMIISTTSAHHQMLFLEDLKEGKDYELLAWASPNRSLNYKIAKDIVIPDNYREVEVCHFLNTNSLGIQGHPEWADDKGPFVRYCNDLLLKLIEKPNKLFYPQLYEQNR